MEYRYEIWLDGGVISDGYGFESYSEAESEGNFAISSYADAYNRHWSEFRLVVEEV
jgi:hypothetical protein